jgi:SPP1 gp7 family putative phage head morphogenesis protein
MEIVSKRKWKYPLSNERAYQKQLTALVNQMYSATTENVSFINGYIKQYRLDDELNTQLDMLIATLIATYRSKVTKEFVKNKIEQMFETVNRFNKNEFNLVLKSALKVDIFQAEPYLNDLKTLWTKQNVSLITSVEDQYFSRVENIVSNAVTQGTLTTSVTQQIQELTGVSKSRAQLIARDQAGKLNGQLTQQRQTGIGIEEYDWSSSHDKKVRPLHVARDGERFSWDKPPSDGHPGYPISCRCVALPVIDTNKINYIGVRK